MSAADTDIKHVSNSNEQIPSVSVLMPCLNESKYLQACLNSLLQNDFRGKIEFIIIDGGSTDGTRELIDEFRSEDRRVKMIENPRRTVPIALNLAIPQASGEIIIRVDAHALYPVNYISRCVAALLESGAANVGGICRVVPGLPSKFGWTIAKVLANRFGVGDSAFRLAQARERQSVDTVPFLCCKKTLFDKVGYFNEKLTRTQDIEFNRRIRNAGGQILLCPEIESTYFARAKLRDMAHHAWKTGLWIVLPFLYTDVTPISWRHLTPLAFITSLILCSLAGFFSFWALFALGLILLLYFSCALIASIHISVKENDITYLALAPFVFATFHFSYGFGSLCGVWQLASSLARNRKLALSRRSD